MLRMNSYPSYLCFCHAIDIPYMIGGDFNILRFSNEKKKLSSLSHAFGLFNSIISVLNLRELHLNGGAFTWSNNQDNPTIEKLDRVLISSEFEDLFPLMSARKLVRDISDHNPIFVTSRDETDDKNKNREFRFELSWLKKMKSSYLLLLKFGLNLCTKLILLIF